MPQNRRFVWVGIVRHERGKLKANRENWKHDYENQKLGSYWNSQRDGIHRVCHYHLCK